MRYEARGLVVYDREEGEVVGKGTTEDEARAFAEKANRQEQDWRSIESVMRTNRSVCG